MPSQQVVLDWRRIYRHRPRRTREIHAGLPSSPGRNLYVKEPLHVANIGRDEASEGADIGAVKLVRGYSKQFSSDVAATMYRTFIH